MASAYVCPNTQITSEKQKANSKKESSHDGSDVHRNSCHPLGSVSCEISSHSSKPSPNLAEHRRFGQQFDNLGQKLMPLVPHLGHRDLSVTENDQNWSHRTIGLGKLMANEGEILGLVQARKDWVKKQELWGFNKRASKVE